MNQSFKVFVYGTLREHESNHHLLKEATCLARQCWTYGLLYDTGFGYPAMVTNKTKRVYGELYEVNAEQLQHLDWLEGYKGEGMSNHYNRTSQTVYTDYEPVDAYVYVYPTSEVEELAKVKFGDWKCHQYLTHDRLLYFAYGSSLALHK